MNKNIFIGGAWPYGNYFMHIGHLVALLPGDVIARYQRLEGNNVIYVSGTDCHGTPITQRAKKEGTTPEKIAKFYHNEFVKTFTAMNFDYNLYTATFVPEHKTRVQELFKRIYDNGFIYEKEEAQDYCEGCAKFLSDREIEGICPHCGAVSNGDQCDACLTELNASELKNKVCKDCKKPVSTRMNKHLYFKLSAFQQDIQELVNKNKEHWRVNAVNETQKYLEQGLKDRAVTRQLNWGVEVPVPGFEDKRLYVWIEAVMGYLTSGERIAKKYGENFRDYLNSTDSKIYLAHGKDNIVFHTIIFPALLLALKDNYAMPTDIISCEYMNMGADKMSKSKGNVITVNELLAKYDCDSIRYYFCLNNPERKDTSFSNEDFVSTHNKHLCGGLGNFVNRNLSFLKKKFDGVIPTGEINEAVRQEIKKFYAEIGKDLDAGEVKSATTKIFEYVQFCNKFYDASEPWVSAKLEDKTKFNNTTATCIYLIANMANLIAPVLPNTSVKICNMLKLEKPTWNETFCGLTKLDEVPILFNKIEEE